MEQKRDREQQRRRDKNSKDSKRGRANKQDGKSSAPWRSGDVIEREGMAESASSSTTPDIDSSSGKQTGANFSRRQLVSNWSKYETILPGYEEESRASDFKSLVTAPMSEGGYFKFKSEQTWDTYSPSQFNNLFTLDLNMLSTSISTIPFYEQLNLSKELFNQDELNRMDKEADENNARYVTLSSKEPVETPNRLVPTASTVSSEHNVRTPLSNSITEGLKDLKLSCSADKESTGPDSTKQRTTVTEELFKPEEDDELDFLLALKEPLKSPVLTSKPSNNLGNQQVSDDTELLVPSTSTESKQEDLDDWLDSILDD